MDICMGDDPSLLLLEENRVILDSLREWLALVFPDVRLIDTDDYGTGLRLIRRESPSIVVMDISNLGRDGVESVRTMKAAQPAAAILALVSLDHKGYRQAILRAGAEACACIWKLRSDLLPHLKKRLLPGVDDAQ